MFLSSTPLPPRISAVLLPFLTLFPPSQVQLLLSFCLPFFHFAPPRWRHSLLTNVLSSHTIHYLSPALSRLCNTDTNTAASCRSLHIRPLLNRYRPLKFTYSRTHESSAGVDERSQRTGYFPPLLQNKE